jgi:hypothetical protein
MSGFFDPNDRAVQQIGWYGVALGIPMAILSARIVTDAKL